MEQDPLAWMRGMGIGPGLRAFELIYGVAGLACELSAQAARAMRRLCRRPRSGPPVSALGRATGQGLEKLLRDRCYAPSTARRYRQIAERYRAWAGVRSGGGIPPAATVARYLEEGMGGAPRRGGDAQHRGLRRTTFYALRAILEGQSELTLSSGVPRLPRPRPVPAAAPEELAALRRGARGVRERLLLVLACDLGLRPGEMAGLRRGDVLLRGGRVRVVLPKRVLEAALPAAGRALLRAALQGGEAASCLFRAHHGDGTVPVTVRTLQRALQQLSRREGVSGVTFTRLRKTCQRPLVARHATRAAGAAPDLAVRRSQEAVPDAGRTAGGAPAYGLISPWTESGGHPRPGYRPTGQQRTARAVARYGSRTDGRHP